MAITPRDNATMARELSRLASTLWREWSGVEGLQNVVLGLGRDQSHRPRWSRTGRQRSAPQQMEQSFEASQAHAVAAQVHGIGR